VEEAHLAYILCPNCRYKTPSGYILCKHCGTPLPGATAPATLLSISIQTKDAYFCKPTLIPVEEGPNVSFILSPGVTQIGRMVDNAVVLVDGLVSRHHAVINRDQAGDYFVVDLNSTNGTFLNEVRLSSPMPVKAGDTLRIGNTTLRFEDSPAVDLAQPGVPLSPDETIISPAFPPSTETDETDIYEAMADTMWGGEIRLGNFRPLARPGWALKHLKGDHDLDYYVLKGLDEPGYIRLSERDVFFWELMDGRHSLRDLLVAYFQRYQAIGTERLLDLLDELTKKGFLQNTEPVRPPEPLGWTGKSLAVANRLMGAFFQKQIALQGADQAITRLYQSFGWRFYTRPGQILLAVIALAGFAGFISILLRGGQSLFVVEGSLALGLIALGVASTLSIFLHELGHALTVKSYNRQVRKLGFMIYFGMPAFFVDTSDIWMEPKGPRLQASLAGPYVSFLVGSVASLAMIASPSPLVADLLFTLAALSFIDAFFNLNPLLELDGYFILMDWLEMPLLRKRSLDFVRRPLWRKIRRREQFTKEERIFTLFGILSAIWSGIAVGMFFIYQGPYLVSIFQGNLEAAASLIVIAFTVLIISLIASRRKRPKDSTGGPSAGGNSDGK
jgi:putative peptide zinc metalloprotease protein